MIGADRLGQMVAMIDLGRTMFDAQQKGLVTNVEEETAWRELEREIVDMKERGERVGGISGTWDG